MTHDEEMKCALLKTRGEDIAALAFLMAEFANSCCYRSDGFEDAAKEFSEEIIRKAVFAEREACAAECERMVMYPGGRQEAPAHNGVWEASRAIRMRSNV